jgi:NTP pyrophosphatase (non-canonical NTP hydrolase)
MNTTTEILTILQEEAAEVIQIASKIHRFGHSSDNIKRLEQELGDLQCMIDLCIEHQLVDETRIQLHSKDKRQKLKNWSNIPLQRSWWFTS